MVRSSMDFDTWDSSTVSPFGADRVWRISALRSAVYLLDQTWDDAQELRRNRLGESTALQLYRAVGSIGANLMEGYSRSSGLDRVRFFEYSLGSARESQWWYYSGRHVLASTTVDARMELLNQIKRLLLVAIPKERRRTIRPDRRDKVP